MLELPPTSGFRPDIQALRGIAVLCVVLYHAQVAMPGGFVGVDVFFVISGFVIGRLLVNRLASSDGLSFGSFYARRARRLLPALSLMLVLVIATTPLLAPTGSIQMATRTGAAAALFNANTYLFLASDFGYFAVATELNPLLHTWSLSVEEQFYFVIPMLVFISWMVGTRSGRPVRALRIFVLGLLAVSLEACLLISAGHSVGPLRGLEFAFFSPLTRAWEFAAGAALVLLPAKWLAGNRRVARTLTAVGLACVFASALRYSDATPFPGIAAILPVAGTALAIYGGTSLYRDGSEPRSRPFMRPAVWLGDISYSWYLWHWPLIVFAGAFWPTAGRLPLVAAALVSLLAAWASFRGIERRFRDSSSGSPRPTIRLAGVCIGAPLVAALLTVPLGALVSKEAAVEQFSESQEFHADVTAGCNEFVPLDQRGVEDCTWEDESGTTSMLLIGDSNAGHYSEALIDAAAANGVRLQIATTDGCPFVDVIVERPDSTLHGSQCHELVVSSLEHIEGDPPDTVVVANHTSAYLTEDRFVLRDPMSTTRATGLDRDTVFESGLERVLTRLRATGTRVVLVNTAPLPGRSATGHADWEPERCSNLSLIVASMCAPHMFDADEREDLRRALATESDAAEHSGVETWNFGDQICPDGQCAELDHDYRTWRDASHLSVRASEALGPVAAEYLASPPE